MAAAATSVSDGSYSTKLGAPYPAARSVHLWWGTPDETPSVFYNEVVVQEHVPGSYFMCVGFSGGYCGIQDNDGQTKTLLFSVWDASDAENDEGATLDDRVQITYEASHVLCKRFGGEGTGAQCIDVTTRWEVGQTVRLMVMQHLEPSGHACYAAWVSSEVAPDWVHLASYRVQKGARFGGFYSFIEDYRRDGETVNKLRRAQYGPAWSWSERAGWMPASEVKFTATGVGDQERPDTIDTDPGTEPGTQMLANGGRLKGEAKLKLPPYQLEPGCTPPTLPPGVNPATFFTTEAPTSPEKDPPKTEDDLPDLALTGVFELNGVEGTMSYEAPGVLRWKSPVCGQDWQCPKSGVLTYSTSFMGCVWVFTAGGSIAKCGTPEQHASGIAFTWTKKH